MHILIVGSFSEFSLETSYLRGFETIGHKVTAFDWDKQYAAHGLASSRLLERISRPAIASAIGKVLVEKVREIQPDVVLVIKGRFILPKTLHAIKKVLSDRPFLNFNPDSPWAKANTTKWLIESVPIYDIHFSWSRALEARFLEAGAKRFEYLPFAYDPKIHFPNPNIAQKRQLPKYDAVFIGTYDPVRDQLLSQLDEFRIAIWGNDWSRSRHVPKEWIKQEAVYGASATQLLDRGIVALNLLREQNLHSHNMRTFEIPATAHTMLTDRSEEQLAFFTEGIEIACFGDIHELKHTLRDISANPESYQFGDAAYSRVRDETYAKRAQTILDAL